MRKILTYSAVKIEKKYQHGNNTVTVLGMFDAEVVVVQFTFLDRLRKTEHEKTIFYRGTSLKDGDELFEDLKSQIEKYGDLPQVAS